MITFDSMEAFNDAVIAAMRERVVVGVTVAKERTNWHDDDTVTNVTVSLFDKVDGIDIDRGSDYA